MDKTEKQLQQALRRVIISEGLATQKDLAVLATRKALEATEETIVATVSQAFQEHQAILTKQLDRIEAVVDAWPPPSYVTGLLERVSAIERQLGIKPALRRAA
ncbi:MAG: hypothetical protein A3J59_04795 [Candidatus Buchananbacteria bacterium RIFCSPHIGHO2_02_FULL_56_16]|uniref:Uncharacterized protein n=1 Tax=Candidatus Buchananbacteria bacterium RIFCSPHIGHO2_02_FULL_56_16 TaxID=1797542 RepID=A0A1G1YCM4_9BACT|nr:MAG: hypothetical protein A3J59_04795 [Candidatus Buchananbacteria bacterium RIFCSPHIGHO2_02_FULL_56_16]